MKFFQKTAFVFFLLLLIFSGNTVEAEGRIYTAKEFEYARLNLEALIERNTRNDNQGNSGENFYIFSTEFADDACELEKVIQHGHSIKDLDCQYLKELNDKLVEINKEANFYVFLDGVRVSDPFVVNEEEAEKIRSKNPDKVDIPILFSYYNNIYKDVEEFTEGLFRQSKLGEIGDQNGALLTITEMLNYLPEYEDNNEVAFITYAKSIVLGEKFKNSYNPIWLKLREKQDEARFSQGFKRALDNHVEACIGEFIHPSEALPCVELLAEYEGHAYLNPTNYFYRIVISNPCVLRDMRALGNPLPESQWMKDFNRVVTAALWVAFAPVAIEVLAPVAIEAALAMGTEKVITDAALGAVIDAALQATIIYYFDLEEDNRNWEEIEKRIDYYQVTASSIESMFSSRLLEAMISTASSCVVDGYTEGGRLRDSFDGMDCLQGALSNLIITGVLNGGKAFKKLKKYASDNPDQFVGKTIYLIRDNVPSFEMSEETLLKVFEQFGIDPEVVKRVWRNIFKGSGKLSARLKDFPKLADKLKELPDKGKQFLDDFASASDEAIEKIGKNPDWVDAWNLVRNAPEAVRKNTNVLEGVSKLSGKKLPNGNVLDVQRLFDNGLAKTLNGASNADKLNIMSRLDSWDVSKVDDLARRLGNSKYSGLADELSDPDFFKLYDDIIHDPENAIDLAKQGGDALLDKVGRSTFFREVTDLGRKFESKMLNDLLDNTSAAYKKLNELVPDLADRKVLQQVQFCVPGKTAPCNAKGEYFIADAVFVKYDSRGRIVDMVVTDSKLSQATNLTSGQALAKNGVGGKLSVKSVLKDVDANGVALPNDGIAQGIEIQLNSFYKIYGDGSNAFMGIE